MSTGTLKQGPYSDIESLSRFNNLFNIYRHPNAIMAARRSVIVDLLLIDGTTRQGLRLQKGIIYDVDFLQVTNSKPTLSQAELWILYLPSVLKAVSYV